MLFLVSILPTVTVMKQQDVFKKIGGIISEINDQYDYLTTTGGVFNDLELELLLANAHFLSDHIEVLRKILTNTTSAQRADAVAAAPLQPETGKENENIELKPEPAPAAEEAPKKAAETQKTDEPRYFEPVVERVPVYASEPAESTVKEEPAAETVEFEIPAKKLNEKQDEPETIRHELTLEDIGDDADEDDEPETMAEEEAVDEAPDQQPLATAEKVKAEQPAEKTTAPAIVIEKEEIITFNQRISAQVGATPRMSDHFEGQTVSDLKSAISLNDKLLFVKDLFNGYSLAYSEAIEILNRLKNFEEAESFLKNYATKNNWQDKPLVSGKFYELLRRRYPAS